MATQAQDKASAVLPSIVPPVSTVDTRGDLSPTNEADRQKLDKLFGARADAQDLQNKGILKGMCRANELMTRSTRRCACR